MYESERNKNNVFLSISTGIPVYFKNILKLTTRTLL